ncbi:MAG TPA: hypothetical protein VE010_09700 [Thermoanaerobaculia bacterium]|nr:hypothetical protein [Thermoanaerobaculia bacterium]
MTSPALRDRLLLASSLLVLIAALAMHLLGVVTRAERGPHMDENEYLHAGWMMANGERLYETFFEHHSPFFFKALELLAPEGERVDVRPYFRHARWLSGTAGLVALVGLALLLSRIGAEVAAIAVALLIATGSLWLYSFLEVRAEPFALAFFAAGTCIALRWRGALGGVGVGLVVITSLWQPKWPLACLAVGVIWLVRSDRRVTGFIAGALTTALAFLAMSAIVPLDMWWFFNFETNRVLAAAVDAPWVMRAYFQGGVPFLFVPDALHPWYVVPAAVLLAASLRFERSAWRALPLILLVAAFIEMRFIYPWPAIWAHYYLMWSVAAAAVLGTVPSSVRILLGRARVPERITRMTTVIVQLAALFLVSIHVAAVFPVGGSAATYWISQKYISERLRPGETIWLESTRHPVSAKDAHYYWFSIGQMTRAAHELRKTERGRRYLPPPERFPLCDPRANVRFTHDPRRVQLPEATPCMQRLVDSGQVRRTVFADVWEIRRTASR